MNDEEKKPKTTIYINSKLNDLLEKEMEKTGKKKSQVIENAINLYLDEMNSKDLSDMEMRMNIENK